MSAVERSLYDVFAASLAIIRAAGWTETSTGVTGYDICTECKRADWNGHAEDCPLSAQIEAHEKAMELLDALLRRVDGLETRVALADGALIAANAELAPYRATDPDIALLASMAACERHDFGLLSKERQAAMLTDMRKLWDEVVGRGYYRPENRGRYTKWLKDHESGGEGSCA